MKKFAFLAVVACLLGCVLTGWASAGSVTYTIEQGTVSGFLGSSSFTDVQVTLTFTGDTANVIHPAAGIFGNLVGTGTVNVAGIGTATFTDSVGVVDNQRVKGTVISDFTNHLSILGTVNDVFATYDLKTSIGPVSGTSSGNPGRSYNTNLGALTFDSFGPTSTFTATVIPEPASLTLFGIGAVVGLLGYGWRQRKRAVA
jgi:hypothetical protein